MKGAELFQNLLDSVRVVLKFGRYDIKGLIPEQMTPQPIDSLDTEIDRKIRETVSEI